MVLLCWELLETVSFDLRDRQYVTCIHIEASRYGIK
jgi:hypothetical protein